MGGNRKEGVRDAAVIGGGAMADHGLMRAYVGPGDYVVCADGGLGHAYAMGVAPDAVVGDLDSMDPATKGRMEADEARRALAVERHPADKDHTDMELAMRRLLAFAGPAAVGLIKVLGAIGTRLDHTAANMHMLARYAEAGFRVMAADERNEVWPLCARPGGHGPAIHRICAPPARAGRRPDDGGPCPGGIGHAPDAASAAPPKVSLIPYGGPVRGVTTNDLRYPLAGAALSPFQAEVSNEVSGPDPTVSITEGTLLIMLSWD